MTFLVTGASSFVGAHFCRLAAARGHRVVGLWRNTRLDLPGVESLRGEIAGTRPPPGTDVVVHLAAKVMADDARAQNRAMMDVVLGWSLPVVYGSSTVVNWPVVLAYADARIEDEARVRAASVPWLVLRPCAPYGPRLTRHAPAHRESFHQLAGWVDRWPMIPVVGDGRYRRQPVHVDDFNGAILGLIARDHWNSSLDAGGPEPLSMREIVRSLAGVRGRRPCVVPVPLRAAVQASRVLPGMRPDLVATFATDDVVDPQPLRVASGVEPRPFDPNSVYAEV